jgi:hypothetical protein
MVKSVSLNRALMGATGGIAALAVGVALIIAIEVAAAKGMSVAYAIVEYFSYFTILTNIFAAVVLLVFCAKPDAKLLVTRPEAISAATVYLASVGLFYALALRNFWNPQGASQVLADVLLHYVIPILCLACWLTFAPKGTLRAINAVTWLTFPLLYWVCIFLRGAISGDYPYPLVDVAVRGYVRALTNATVHLATTLLLGLLAVATDRWLARISIAQKVVKFCEAKPE